MLKTVVKILERYGENKCDREGQWVEQYRGMCFQEGEDKILVNDETSEVKVCWSVKDWLTDRWRKKKKKTGPDGITMELAKHGVILLLRRLVYSLNQCWQSSNVSETWKTGESTSLFKKGGRKEC